MKKTLPLIAVLLIPMPAFAEEWACYDRGDYKWKKVLVVALAHEDKKTGAIKVAGTEHPTRFAILGFDRRWDFGESDSYAFIIKPNGNASYYDFSTADEEGKVSPSIFFKCREKRVRLLIED